MDLYIRILFGKLKRSLPINKLELTSIDRHLTCEQKKRIVKFFREEAAKRTKYEVEPTWTILESVQMVVKDDCRDNTPGTLEEAGDITTIPI